MEEAPRMGDPFRNGKRGLSGPEAHCKPPFQPKKLIEFLE